MARKPNAAPPKLDTETINSSETEEELIIAPDEEDAEQLDAGEPDAAEESVDELRKQLADANSRAEREAAARIEAEKRVDQAGNAVADSNLRAIDNAISSAVSDKKGILAEITAAKEAGDYAKEADALDRLQTLNIKVSRLGEGKAELERRIEEAKDQEELQRDPLEGYIANAKLNGQAAAWVRQHPDIILTNGNIDRQKLGELEAAHFVAVGARHRLAPGSAEYFEFIESELLGGNEEQDEPVTPAPKPNGSKQPPAARPSRTVNADQIAATNRNLPAGVTRRADGTYQMSAARREAARIAGISDPEYLKNLLELQREGQLTH
jgi:hypothetical protein